MDDQALTFCRQLDRDLAALRKRVEDLEQASCAAEDRRAAAAAEGRAEVAAPQREGLWP